MAARFLESIYVAPRELLDGRYGLRVLSGTTITIPEYLDHLNLLKTDTFFREPELIRWGKDDRCVPGAVIKRAHHDLLELRNLRDDDPTSKEMCKELLRLLTPEAKRLFSAR